LPVFPACGGPPVDKNASAGYIQCYRALWERDGAFPSLNSSQEDERKTEKE